MINWVYWGTVPNCWAYTY